LLAVLRGGPDDVADMLADLMLRREGPGFAADLPLGLCSVDASLAMEATDAILALFGTFPMDARFLRAMVMPTDNAGQTVTIKNKAGQPNKKRGQHRLLVDQVITAHESI